MPYLAIKTTATEGIHGAGFRTHHASENEMNRFGIAVGHLGWNAQQAAQLLYRSRSGGQRRQVGEMISGVRTPPQELLDWSDRVNTFFAKNPVPFLESSR